MGRVQDKIAIITGGAGGIGGATARLLAREGAKVVITDLQEDAGRALAGEIKGTFLRHDVTDEARWGEIVASVEKSQGGLHILVNAAGIEGDMTQGAPDTATLAEWRRVHAVNLDGTFLGCRTALPAMRKSGGGSIINLSSIMGLIAAPFSAPYGSSKAGVKSLSMSVAATGAMGEAKVRCNSIHPGLIDTRMLHDIHATRARSRNISFDDSRASSVDRVPLGYIGAPEDVAYMILYLASDESRYVTGAGFNIDGGWSLGTPR